MLHLYQMNLKLIICKKAICPLLIFHAAIHNPFNHPVFPQLISSLLLLSLGKSSLQRSSLFAVLSFHSNFLSGSLFGGCTFLLSTSTDFCLSASTDRLLRGTYDGFFPNLGRSILRRDKLLSEPSAKVASLAEASTP